MPRLPPRLFHRARNIHGLLPLVLRTARDLSSAQNELRWLSEHVISQAPSSSPDRSEWRRYALRHLCLGRAQGKPLQYLLGSEYFGDLEIKCRSGVLIPRQETAASISHLAARLIRPPNSLHVLDLCTGTGCIPLLFQHDLERLHPRQIEVIVLGVDVSPDAVRLARHNLDCQERKRNISATVNFALADVLAKDTAKERGSVPVLAAVLRNHDKVADGPRWDILISNPPYISPREFDHTTSRSVRNFEPRLALVPDKRHHVDGIDPGDVFYPRLLEIARQVNSKMILFEVADMEQAQRVASMAISQGGWTGVEIWRDDPGSSDEAEKVFIGSSDIRVKGSGNGRSVFAWRGEANYWLDDVSHK